jgi:hypothetical protein
MVSTTRKVVLLSVPQDEGFVYSIVDADTAQIAINNSGATSILEITYKPKPDLDLDTQDFNSLLNAAFTKSPYTNPIASVEDLQNRFNMLPLTEGIFAAPEEIQRKRLNKEVRYQLYRMAMEWRLKRANAEIHAISQEGSEKYSKLRTIYKNLKSDFEIFKKTFKDEPFIKEYENLITQLGEELSAAPEADNTLQNVIETHEDQLKFDTMSFFKKMAYTGTKTKSIHSAKDIFNLWCDHIAIKNPDIKSALSNLDPDDQKTLGQDLNSIFEQTKEGLASKFFRHTLNWETVANVIDAFVQKVKQMIGKSLPIVGEPREEAITRLFGEVVEKHRAKKPGRD